MPSALSKASLLDECRLFCIFANGGKASIRYKCPEFSADSTSGFPAYERLVSLIGTPNIIEKKKPKTTLMKKGHPTVKTIYPSIYGNLGFGKSFPRLTYNIPTLVPKKPSGADYEYVNLNLSLNSTFFPKEKKKK